MENIKSLINRNIQYFDLTRLDFKEVIIDHDVNKFDQQSEKINRIVPKELGMYIYTSATDNKVLYVGEGVLQERIKRHLQKVRDNHSQESTRYYFFHALQIKMSVLFIKGSNTGLDKKRIQNLECAYKLLLNPIYDQMVEKAALYKGCNINLDEWDN